MTIKLSTGPQGSSGVPSVGEELVSSRLERTGASGGDELLPYGGDTIIVGEYSG